jgi:hypothetical protein
MFLDIKLTSMSVDGKERRINTLEVTSILKNIAAVLDSIPFEERLIEISYFGDNQIATVTTSYKFYYNRFLSHIETNKFTLFFRDDKWIIVGLANTRILV